jgi:hypothetical protein
MEDSGDMFELDYKGAKIKVQETTISGQIIFRVQIPSNPKVLFITRVNNSFNMPEWVSTPEGRSIEAEEIGQLIENYYSEKK